MANNSGEISGVILGHQKDVLPSGVRVVETRIAGECQVEGRATTFVHTVVAFGKLADVLSGHPEGSCIHVEGSLDYRSWKEAGKSRSRVRVKAFSIKGIQGTVVQQGSLQVLQDALNLFKVEGLLGADPTYRDARVSEVGSFSVAVRDSRGQTHWFRVDAWSDTLGVCKSLQVGQRVMVHGVLRTETYGEGEKRRSLQKLRAERITPSQLSRAS